MKSVFLASIVFVTACATNHDDPIVDPDLSWDVLSASVAFGVDNYPTPADCEAAKTAGQIPPMATCQNQLLLCTNGEAHEYTGDVVSTGDYLAKESAFKINFAFGYNLEGTLAADGTLHTIPIGQTYETVWKPIAVSDVTVVGCN